MGRSNHYVIVCGGRDPDGATLAAVDLVIDFLHKFYGGTLRVLHGDADGVDARAKLLCDQLGITAKAYPADWGRGRRAGPERNRKMATNVAAWVTQGHSGQVVAFEGGRGTASMISIARELELPVDEIPTVR